MFKVAVYPVASVVDHPNADRLSLVLFDVFQCISAKVDGVPRYKEGDRILFVPDGAVVPEWLLKKGFWDDEKNIGLLDGEAGNIVRRRKVRGSYTDGILFAVDTYDGWEAEKGFVLTQMFKEEDGFAFTFGADISILLGITEEVKPEAESK